MSQSNKKPETRYLVLLCHTMDDLPVALVDTWDKAVAIARSYPAYPDDIIRNVFNTDCSTPCCTKVVTFHGGVPIKCDVIVEEFFEIPILGEK